MTCNITERKFSEETHQFKGKVAQDLLHSFTVQLYNVHAG
jgi:hypothetical protein